MYIYVEGTNGYNVRSFLGGPTPPPRAGGHVWAFLGRGRGVPGPSAPLHYAFFSMWKMQATYIFNLFVEKKTTTKKNRNT